MASILGKLFYRSYPSTRPKGLHRDERIFNFANMINFKNRSSRWSEASRGIRTALVISLFLFTTTIFPATVQLKVSSIDNQVLKEAGIGQPFLLHVIVNNASNTAQYPIIKNVENYSIRRTGFQMNMVNGSTSTTYTYQIRIDELGTYTLGPAQITENNGVVESEPIIIAVANEQKYADAKRTADSKSKASFLRLTCNKEKLSVGERAQCTLTFYTADQMVSLQSLIEPDQTSMQKLSKM